MSQAVRIHEIGGPEVLQLEEVKDSAPGEGELVISQTAVGINFIDTYHRRGLYPLPLPATLGIEGCGYVEEIGKNVQGGMKVGDRVAYATGPVGAYCERRVISQEYVVSVPNYITDEQAAAALAKGLTAHYLLCRTFVIQPGITVMLVHAAAGGVGQMLCQWGSFHGCTVIGTVGSEEKVEIARQNGCAHVINYNTEDFVERIWDITKGMGVNVVYDSVGKDTFMKSLACLKPFGMMVSYGQSSGAVPPFDLSILSDNCLFLTRPTLSSYKKHRLELVLSAAEVFDMLRQGGIRVNINNRYTLDEAAQAHYDLEERHTTGSSIFVL